MKNLDLNKYGVQEMNAGEIICIDGGSEARASTYMTGAQMRAVGRAIVDGFDAVCGFCNGFFGF